MAKSSDLPRSRQSVDQKAQQLFDSGKTNDAAQSYKNHLESDPEWLEGWLRAAIIFHGQGALEDAIAAYLQVLRLEPGNATALGNLGIAHAARGEFHDARPYLLKAAKTDPKSPTNANNLGHLLYRLGEHKEAEKWLRLAVSFQPDFVLAWSNLGDLHRIQGQWAQSADCYRTALQYQPDNGVVLSNLFYALRTICDWSTVADIESKLLALSRIALSQDQSAPLDPFVACFTRVPGLLFKNIMNSHAKPYARAIEVRGLSGRYDRRPSRRDIIRVGYMSAAFREHATGHLASSLFSRHNRELFRIYGYALSADDGGRLRQEIASGMDKFADLTGAPDVEVADTIFRDEIDVLIDLDGYIQNNRFGILALRPAPVQATYLGFPGTTGAPYIDYLIGDPVVTPEDRDDHYQEALMRLPHTYQFNQHRRLGAPEQADPRDYGLPSGRPILCNFNVSRKIDQASFALWMRILDRVPEAILWILVDDDSAMNNLRKSAEDSGVAAERLFRADRLPIRNHLRRCTAGDLFLDTLIYNAHTTATDALWAGLPVLTLPGEGFASRVGASLVRAAGLPGLIARSNDDYVEKAVALIKQTDALQSVKARLCESRLVAPLFDSTRFVRHLENGILTMHHIACSGSGPKPIWVDPIYPVTPATEGTNVQ